MTKTDVQVEKLEKAMCKLCDWAKSQQSGQAALQFSQSVQFLAQARLIGDPGRSENIDLREKLSDAVCKLTDMSAVSAVGPSAQQYAQAVLCLKHAELAISGDKSSPAKKTN